MTTRASQSLWPPPSSVNLARQDVMPVPNVSPSISIGSRYCALDFRSHHVAPREDPGRTGHKMWPKQGRQLPRFFERELYYLPFRARRSRARAYPQIAWPIFDRLVDRGLSEIQHPTHTTHYYWRSSP